jgi:hypothetical protein
MQQRKTRVNPAEETIKIGPLWYGFALEAFYPAMMVRFS